MSISFASKRDQIILQIVNKQGYISLRELADRVHGSPSTLQRDLDRLHHSGKLSRIRAGVRRVDQANDKVGLWSFGGSLEEFEDADKVTEQAIGKAAAKLCSPGEPIVIDGSVAALAMCPHVEHLNLHVLTNSLSALHTLLAQDGTRTSIVGGVVFRKQNIILEPAENGAGPRFHASKMFLGPSAVTRSGLMQSDPLLLLAQQMLLGLAEELIVLIDSRKLNSSGGYWVCDLAKVHTLITDSGVLDAHAAMIESHGIKLLTLET